MILYNTIVGLAAGVGLLLVAQLLKRFAQGEKVQPEGFAGPSTTEGIRKVGAGKGEKLNIAGAHLTWKAKRESTGYAFSICEQTLAPGEGGPLHSHSSAEAFYVLSGAADFFRLVHGKESEPCRLLGISTPSHQAFFDEVARADKKKSLASVPFPEAMRLVAQIGAQYNFYFAPVDITKPVGQR